MPNQINNINQILESKLEVLKQTRHNSSWIESKEMYLPLDLLQAHFITYLQLMTEHTINGVILKLDSTHSKNQEIIGLLNQQDQDSGQLNQPQIQINSYLVFKMKEMDMNSISEPIHLLKIEIDGSLMDSMVECYIHIHNKYKFSYIIYLINNHN